MTKKHLTLLFLISISSCATGYSKFSLWNDGGFSETEVQPNMFTVRFNGNEFTSETRASEFSMLRASELCLARELPYMELSNLDAKTTASSVPGSSTTTSNFTAYGNTVYGVGTTTYNPDITFYSPKAGLTVACVPEKSASSWDAKFLESSLKSKYGIK